MPKVGRTIVSWPMAIAGLTVGALVPVLAFAIVLYPLAVLVLAYGMPIALAVAFFAVLPLCALLSRHDRLSIVAALAIGAIAASIPYLALQNDLMLRTLTGAPYIEGVKGSASNGVWEIRDGYLTATGWLNHILLPTVLFSALGAAGALIGWYVATIGASQATTER
ncbi:MAG: hypothetical protein ABL907_12425 [Hyphomicrobium sp.]